MRSSPMLLKLFAHPFRDQMHRQTGGVGGNDSAGLAKLRDARQQIFLDVQIFGDDFDDPIRFRATRQIIVEISDGDAIRE